MFGEGYVAFKQKKDKGEEHAKNTFLIMEGLSGRKPVIPPMNWYCLSYVNPRRSFMKVKDSVRNLQLRRGNFRKLQGNSGDSEPDAEASGNQKKFKEQVVKPNIQALFSGEKTPEQIAQDFKDKGKQILGQ